MKVFLDTNILMEFLGHRNLFDDVQNIIRVIIDGYISAVMSSAGFYTLTYLFDKGLKQKDIHEPQKSEMVRKTLKDILSYIHIVDISHESILKGLNDSDFKDIEDSYQYQCAIENNCQILLTINEKHFRNVSQEQIEILTPKQFLEKYIL